MVTVLYACTQAMARNADMMRLCNSTSVRVQPLINLVVHIRHSTSDRRKVGKRHLLKTTGKVKKCDSVSRHNNISSQLRPCTQAGSKYRACNAQLQHTIRNAMQTLSQGLGGRRREVAV